MKLYKMITYSGWMALILLITSVYFIVVRKDARLHMDFAIAAFVFIIIHVGLVLYPKLKRR